MKLINKWLLAFLPVAVLTSCADDEFATIKVQEPAYLAQMQYLSDYDVLKNYVNREANPNFKLGLAVDGAEYAKLGAVYGLATSNFDEVVAGNEMKYGSIVKDNGSMNFATVIDFVKSAKSAKQTIYGHTLAWHSQQNTKYLNSLIADKVDPNYVPEKVEVTKHEDRGCIVVHSDDMKDAAWDTQFWLNIGEANAIHTGDKWEVSIDVRADKEASAGTQAHTSAGNYKHWDAIGTVSFTTEWQTYAKNGTFSAAEQDGCYTIAFNLNDFAEANNYYFDNISLKVNGVEMIKNNDCEGDDNSSYIVKEMRGTVANAEVDKNLVKGIDYTVLEFAPMTVDIEYNKPCFVAKALDKAKDAWDSQFWIVTPKDKPYQKGDKWEYSMKVRADKNASIGTQVHRNPGDYLHWEAIGNVDFTTEWTTVTKSGTFGADQQTGGYSIAFNLNDFAEANTYYFANVSFKVNGVELVSNPDMTGTDNECYYAKLYPGNPEPVTLLPKVTYTVEKDTPGVPLTAEQKYDTLKYAMDKWIAGIMEATEGYVEAWDVVNEALSGAGDVDGLYELQHELEGNGVFCWQDYLGDIDYVRIAVASARKHFAANGGKAENLKLFINDYNLESWWDGNKKLSSLIGWIKKWEADGQTKIDGIGTQMHISCYEKPENQAAIEASIVNMFKLMAASGKLCRISELDMGYVAADDMFADPLKTNELTEEQHKKMAKFYSFIVRKYYEIIPVAQQYGITQWCATDAPTSSGWRGGEPVGLWDINYNRKHTYAGFAEGLQGKEYDK